MTRPKRVAYDPVKRALDIVASAVGLLALSPVIGMTAIMVGIKLGRPVIFSQPRPGRNGEIFTLYKFRTMFNANPDNGAQTDEERLTKFGRVLRAISLDELPSLVNVFNGDMSVVGPRPLLVQYLELYTPEQARRHDVRPGVTGLAQVNGRNLLSWPEKFALDLAYVTRRSFTLDAQIVWKTIGTVVRRSGISSRGHATAPAFTGTKQEDDL